MATALMVCHNSGGSSANNPSGTQSIDDMIFGFLEDGDQPTDSSFDSNIGFNDKDYSSIDNEEENNPCKVEQNRVFWESQEELLQETLFRTTSLESKVMQATKEAIRELMLELEERTKTDCMCNRSLTVPKCCRNCIQREITARLRGLGFDCAVCKSKWRSSPEIPSGEHTYMEVRESTNKGEVKRVIIELNLRSQFEIVRAGEDHKRLINHLPELFVGRMERLRTLIKIMCSASKKCLKERNMHMAPWRKHKYMQAKWLGTREHKTPQQQTPALAAQHLDKLPKQRTSMLTFDLLENFPGLHSTPIKVV